MIKHLLGATRKDWIPYLIAFLVLINNVIWMRSIPYNGAPDEIDHYTVCKFISDHNRLPVFGKDISYYWMSITTKRPVTQSELDYYRSLPQERLPQVLFEKRYPYVLHPYFSYILSAFFVKLLSFLSKHPLVPLFGARFISSVCGALTVFFTFKIATKIFKDNLNLAILSAVFVGTLPQFTFVSSYVNQDAFTAFIATLTFFIWLKCLESWNIKRSVWLGCCIGFLILSKLNGYIVICLTGLFAIFFLRKNRKNNIRIVLTVLLCAFVISGWFFIRSHIVYGNWWVPNVADKLCPDFMPKTPAFILDHIGQYKLGIELPVITFFLKAVFASFWGVFGWMNILMPKSFYYITFAMTLIGISGFIRMLYAPVFSDPRKKYAFILMLLSCPMMFGLIILFSTIFDLQPQGRYFFPCIAPIAICFSWGWLSLFKKEKYHRLMLIAMVTLLIGINVFSFLVCIVRKYYLLST